MERTKVGVVTSRFNEEITSKLEAGALTYLESFDVEIFSVRVPGAVEIPLACKALFNAGCEGVVALGAVIRGETTHYESVCTSVERGVTHLMLETGRPIGFGVLMTENDEQAEARSGGAHGNKGAEAAQVVMEMMGLLKDLSESISPTAARGAKARKSAGAGSKKSKTKKKRLTR
jgi:6,7-dimethyl-8-ribityllumazine synthase